MSPPDLADLSLAPPPYTPPFLIEPDEEYPYSKIHGRELEQKILREWLLGSSSNPQRPLGGAALVTGFRGVGKTTFVRKVLFDVAVAGLYQVSFSSEARGEGWGPFNASKEDFKKKIKALEKSPLKDGEATLFIPIHLDVPNPITATALMHRLMRRTYLKLVEYQIGEFRPDILRKARLGYMRTLGKLDVEISTTFKQTLGVSLDALAKLEVTASQEMEFAESMKLAAEGLSVEEAEDEIFDIGEILSAIRLGKVASLTKRMSQALSERFIKGFQRLHTFFQGDSGQRVHLVYVFDELDKLQRFETTGSEQQPSEKGTPPQLREALEMIQQLKTLFSTHNISAIVIGGIGLERQWAEEVAGADPLLRSIFSRHVYVPQIQLQDVKKLLGDTATDQNALYLAFVTQGRYKQLLREIGHLRTMGHLPNLADRLSSVLTRIAGGWTTAVMGTAAAMDTATVGLVKTIESAANIEDLIKVIISNLPPQYLTEFGLDIVRSFFVGAYIKLQDPLFKDEEREKWLKSVAVEYSHFAAMGTLTAALDRVDQLISTLRDVTAATPMKR